MSTSKTYTASCSAVGGYSYAKYFTLYVELTDSGGSSSTNKSNVKYNVYCQSSGSGSISAKHTLYFKLNGTTIIDKEVSVSASSPNAKISIASGTLSVSHNNDGSKSVSFSASIKASSYGVSASKSGSFDCEKIARYFSSTPTFTLSSQTETSLTYKWNTSETCSKVVAYYKKSNESSYSNTTVYNNSTGAKTSTFTLNGLNANTSYIVYLTCTRKDNGLTSNSATLTKSTYNYPYVSDIGSNPLTIGDGQKLTLYNPLGRNCTVYMKQNSTSGTQFYSGTTSGTSISFTPNADNLYASIPNSISGNAVYYCTYGSNTVSTKSGTYKVKGNEGPTFNNFEFLVENTYYLTGDYSKIIPNYSNVIGKITEENKAIANNSANLSSYRMVIGNSSSSTSNLSSYPISLEISNVTNTQIDMYAIDSRGLAKVITAYTKSINYWNINISSMSVKRLSNVGEEAILEFNINFWNDTFGVITNTIRNIGYRYKPTYSNTYVEGTTPITYTKSGNTATGSLSIAGDLGADGFDASNSYNIQLYVEDALSSATATITLGAGTPAIAIYKNKLAIGGKYDKELGGVLQINGDVYFSQNDNEKSIFFKNTLNGNFPHNSKIYGGNGNSISTVGIWDSANNRAPLVYQDASNTLVSDTPMQQQCITAKPNSSQTFTSATKITLNTIFNEQDGSGILSLSDGGILCGRDGKVFVYGNIGYKSAAAGNISCDVKKNSSYVSYHNAYSAGTQGYTHSNSVPIIFKVSAGDIIYLYGNNSNGTIQESTTYLTVQYVS
jgi:hypothetical protein